MRALYKFSRRLIPLLILPSLSLATDNLSSTIHQGEYPEYPVIDYSKLPANKVKQVQRGEYLTRLGDCIACHTGPGGKSFAGGHQIKTPFGSIYTPNITPDKTTGIGNWSEKDFMKAMREGKSPSGSYYYPAFPYPYFNILTDADIKAIKAYLNVIPAVEQKNKKNDMHFPFSWRFLQLGWRMLFFDNDGTYKPDNSKSAEWNRGKYLVDGLGHCSMCHTPMHYLISKKWVLGAPVKKYYLTGAMVLGFYAPNITSTSLKNTHLQEIADVFLKDRLIGGGKVLGPMEEANHDSLKYLHPEDIKAIAIYLKTVKSEIPPKPKSSSKDSGPGEKIYTQYCANCHANGAGGAPVVGNTQAWEPRIKQGLNTLYKNAINGIGGMPAKGTCSSCSVKEIQAAVQYMVNQSKPGAKSSSTNIIKGKAFKKLTAEDGKVIYEKHCSYCHNGSNPEAPKLGDKATWDPLLQKGFDILVINSIKGYKNMPAKGGCAQCNDAQIKSAVKYMVKEANPKGDYSLW